MKSHKWVLTAIGISLVLAIALALLMGYNPTRSSHGKEEVQENISSKNGYSKFYTRGSYSTPFQSEKLVFSNYEIALSLVTVANILEDFNDPQYIKPNAAVRLMDITTKTFFNYDCPKPTIRIDKVACKSVETPIGVINFNGIFVDKKDKPWTKKQAENYETFFKGILVITKDGTIVFSKEVKLEYWNGTGD